MAYIYDARKDKKDMFAKARRRWMWVVKVAALSFVLSFMALAVTTVFYHARVSDGLTLKNPEFVALLCLLGSALAGFIASVRHTSLGNQEDKYTPYSEG